jgi:hypothetical protein
MSHQLHTSGVAPASAAIPESISATAAYAHSLQPDFSQESCSKFNVSCTVMISGGTAVSMSAGTHTRLNDFIGTVVLCLLRCSSPTLDPDKMSPPKGVKSSVERVKTACCCVGHMRSGDTGVIAGGSIGVRTAPHGCTHTGSVTPADEIAYGTVTRAAAGLLTMVSCPWPLPRNAPPGDKYIRVLCR